MSKQAEKKLLLEELLSRESNALSLETQCFPAQLAFINDPNRFRTAVCTRRAGKSVSCALHLLKNASSKKEVMCAYITLSRKSAKRILWPILKKYNTEFKLGGVPNETEISMTFPNGSVIYLSGAKDETEIEKFRGLPLDLTYIDETQSMRPSLIEKLINDILIAASIDTQGAICLIGTPGPIPKGYFYQASHSKKWSNHHWGMQHNTYLLAKSGKTFEQILQEELERKGVTIEDPSIQREFLGRWVVDTNSLVFRYDPIKNHYTDLPDGKKWNYVIAVDIGFDDADAISVVGWEDNSPNCYLIEEIVKNKQGITELASDVTKMVTKYQPMKVIGDFGGLGKKIGAELRKRFSIPIEAAEKSRKFEYIEFLNDAMRTGRFFAKNTSRFAEDCMLLEFDRTKQDKLKIKDTFHSDALDSCLYAFRESLHYTFKSIPQRPNYLSLEWHQRQLEAMEQAAQDEYDRRKRDEQEASELYGLGDDGSGGF